MSEPDWQQDPIQLVSSECLGDRTACYTTGNKKNKKMKVRSGLSTAVISAK
jgi:hypothetical protein